MVKCIYTNKNNNNKNNKNIKHWRLKLAYTNSTSLGTYLNEVKKHNLLTKEQEIALAKRIEKGDKRAAKAEFLDFDKDERNLQGPFRIINNTDKDRL